jgi:hypothetical protein
VDEFSSAFPGVNDKLEGDRMVLRHIRSHVENHVGIQQIVWRSGGAAATE